MAFPKVPKEAVEAVLLQTHLEASVLKVAEVAETYLPQMEHSVRVAVVRRAMEVMPIWVMPGLVVSDVLATLSVDLLLTAGVVVVVVILYVAVVLHWVAEATGGQVLTASLGLMDWAAVVVVLARLA